MAKKNKYVFLAYSIAQVFDVSIEELFDFKEEK